VHVRRLEEHVVPGKRLGRHVRWDPRSLAYQAAEADPATLTSARHHRRIGVLDQGDLGSCTGQAAEGCLGTSPFYETLPGWFKEGANFDAVEAQAVSLYSTATQLDDYSGEYPPLDTGSDGLSVAKACKAAGLISGYRHATSLNAALTALASQPVITGIPWYDSFDDATEEGQITIGRHARPRGGHEVVLDELEVERERVWFTNSWGEAWGSHGRAALSWDDFGRLLSEDGDVTVFVPLTQPAPSPAPLDPDAELTGCLTSIVGSAQRALDILRRRPN
jgi:hypothetical protein